jgi:hypothetical protein
MVTQLMLIEVIPNGLVARHTHPGGEVGYVLEGVIEFTIGEGPRWRPTDQPPVGIRSPPNETGSLAGHGPAALKEASRETRVDRRRRLRGRRCLYDNDRE